MPEDSDTQANYGRRIRAQENMAHLLVCTMSILT